MTKKKKVIPCPICSGLGSYIKEIMRKTTPDNDVLVVKKLIECDYCKAKGYVTTDDLTYHIEYNTIKNKLYNLYNDKDEEATIYKICDKCNGKGIEFAETLSSKESNITIEVYKQCECCDGIGEVVNEKETLGNKKGLISHYTKILDNLILIQKHDFIDVKKELKNCPKDRTDVEFIIDNKYNICLNCIYYKKNKYGLESGNYYCENCCHYNDSNCNNLFKGIGKNSEMWYNKYINPLTRIK